MSEPTLPSSPVFTDPTAVADVPAGSDVNAVDATTAPVQLTGSSQTFTTTNAAPGQTANVVVSGLNNTLNLGTGAANVAVIGDGAIVESVQLLDSAGVPIPDAGKAITLGDPTVPYNGGVVDTTAAVSGDSIGSTETVAQSAGGQAPSGGGGFAYYVHGGTGNDSIIGSSQNDYIRGGAGDDSISSGGGNDLVRGGAGSDSIFTGLGIDTLYYTADQIGASTDIWQDFTSGVDKLTFDAGITATISSDGLSVVLSIVASGATTTVTSQSGLFAATDLQQVNFIG
ncbi:calcium-binding protein [Cyanobium sp. ATX 6F1]|uniref:calcium-binding protein n=1 Tax=unclassified Cyanobium TaxID=2627006 RepID=UPI0020CE16BA|nr:hypothetical protein [Cyanobium sp. ATX 6F1]MCP9917485.1 hypothetical protein [Cyanobium sp. ATX 6F1]